MSIVSGFSFGDTSSGLQNDQLVPIAMSSAVYPSAAIQANIGTGAGPSNLPGFAISGGATMPATQTPASGTPSVGAVASDVQGMTLWQSPMVLTIVLLVAAYLMLRFVHYRG